MSSLLVLISSVINFTSPTPLSPQFLQGYKPPHCGPCCAHQYLQHQYWLAHRPSGPLRLLSPLNNGERKPYWLQNPTGKPLPTDSAQGAGLPQTHTHTHKSHIIRHRHPGWEEWRGCCETTLNTSSACHHWGLTLQHF